jgi:hypothetical protein
MPGFIALMSSKISRGHDELCTKVPVQWHSNLSFFQRREIPGIIEHPREIDHAIPNLIHPPLEHGSDSIHLQDGPQRLRRVLLVGWNATTSIAITYAVSHELRIGITHVNSFLVVTLHPNKVLHGL